MHHKSLNSSKVDAALLLVPSDQIVSSITSEMIIMSIRLLKIRSEMVVGGHQVITNQLRNVEQSDIII